MVGEQNLLTKMTWTFLCEYILACAGVVLGFIANPWQEWSWVAAAPPAVPCHAMSALCSSSAPSWGGSSSPPALSMFCPCDSCDKEGEDIGCLSSHCKTPLLSLWENCSRCLNLSEAQQWSHCSFGLTFQSPHLLLMCFSIILVSEKCVQSTCARLCRFLYTSFWCYFMLFMT